MKKVIIVVGLGFGDEGKGNIISGFVAGSAADMESLEEDITVVRFGGPQAVHRVVDPRSGVSHCSRQFSSGVLFPGCKSFLSRHMLIKLDDFIEEHVALQRIGIYDAQRRLRIDPRCGIVPPVNEMLNRMKEVARDKNRHGSCGMGVGLTALDRELRGKDFLVIGDTRNTVELKRKIEILYTEKFTEAVALLEQYPDSEELATLFAHYREQLSSQRFYTLCMNFASLYASCMVDENYMDEITQGKGFVFVEASQGALLHKTFGFVPFVTKTNTAFSCVDDLLTNIPRRNIHKLGVLRAYFTRHGAGPFVTHDEELTISIPDSQNTLNEWQGGFRVGWFDLPAARYGIMVNDNDVDSIALTCLDRLSGMEEIRVCRAYECDAAETDESTLANFFEWETNAGKILIKGFRKTERPVTEQVGKILQRCRPQYIKLKGWKEDISKAKSLSELPSEARAYVSFIEKELGVPVSMITVGPTWNDNLVIDQALLKY